MISYVLLSVTLYDSVTPISLLTSEARGTVAGGGAPACRALCASGAHSLLHVDVRGGADIVGELNNAEQRES